MAIRTYRFPVPGGATFVLDSDSAVDQAKLALLNALGVQEVAPTGQVPTTPPPIPSPAIGRGSPEASGLQPSAGPMVGGSPLVGRGLYPPASMMDLKPATPSILRPAPASAVANPSPQADYMQPGTDTQAAAIRDMLATGAIPSPQQLQILNPKRDKTDIAMQQKGDVFRAHTAAQAAGRRAPTDLQAIPEEDLSEDAKAKQAAGFRFDPVLGKWLTPAGKDVKAATEKYLTMQYRNRKEFEQRLVGPARPSKNQVLLQEPPASWDEGPRKGTQLTLNDKSTKIGGEMSVTEVAQANKAAAELEAATGVPQERIALRGPQLSDEKRKAFAEKASDRAAKAGEYKRGKAVQESLARYQIQGRKTRQDPEVLRIQDKIAAGEELSDPERKKMGMMTNAEVIAQSVQGAGLNTSNPNPLASLRLLPGITPEQIEAINAWGAAKMNGPPAPPAPQVSEPDMRRWRDMFGAALDFAKIAPNDYAKSYAHLKKQFANVPDIAIRTFLQQINTPRHIPRSLIGEQAFVPIM